MTGRLHCYRTCLLSLYGSRTDSVRLLCGGYGDCTEIARLPHSLRQLPYGFVLAGLFLAPTPATRTKRRNIVDPLIVQCVHVNQA